MKFRAIALVLALLVPVLPAQAANTVLIGVAYDTGGLGDLSYNDATAAGIKMVRTGAEFVSVVTDGSAKNREARLRTLISKGANPIIAIGAGYVPALNKLAIEYPETQFAIMNDATIEALNVTSIVFADIQGAYLAGAAAALTSKSGKVAMIASPNQNALFTQGFSAGAIAARKKIKVSVQYSATNQGLLARNLIAAGNDVIFMGTSGSVDEAFSEVVKANKAKKSVGLISVEPDQYLTVTKSTQKYLYATVEKRADRAMRDFIKASIAGEQFLDFLDPDKGIYGRRYGIKGGGIEIALRLPSLAAQSSAINALSSLAEKISA